MKLFAVIFAFVFLWPGAAFPSLAKLVTQNGSARASFNYNPAERPLALSGLRQAARETINGVGRNVDYFHDPLNRLTKETVGAASLIYDSDAGYGDAAGFDKVGNRRSRTAGAALETAGLLYYASQSFDVNDYIGADDNGSRPDPTQDNNGNTVAYGSYTYGYELENRLISRSGGTALTLIYDGDGKRVRKKEGAVGPETWYLWDELNPTGYAQIIEERKSPSGPPSLTDAPTAHYVYGLDLVSQKRSSGSYYYGYDGHGSVRYLTAHGVNGVSDGTVTDIYTYDAFGVQIAPTSSNPNVYRYTGQQWDEHLGMYYLRARYYHPDLGRFWTMDSFEGNPSDPLSLHKYLYCHANPVNRIDPSGHESLASLSLASSIGTSLHSMYDAGVSIVGFGLKDAIQGVAAGKSQEEILHEYWSSTAKGLAIGFAAGFAFSMVDDVVYGAKTVVQQGWRPVVGSGNAYSVAFEMRLPPGAFPGRSRGSHFQAANEELLKKMTADSEFAQIMETLIPGIRNQLAGPRGGISRRSPKDWTWHHDANTGIMQLVPLVQHTAPGKLQTIFHQAGKGGMAFWGK